jgi:hypothetical protein
MMTRVAVAVFIAASIAGTAGAEEKKYRVVDASDVQVATKCMGKDIEIRNARLTGFGGNSGLATWDQAGQHAVTNWVYANVDDYRCPTSAWVTIFTIEGESRKWVEENCDTLTKAFAPKCKVTIRFEETSVSSFGEHRSSPYFIDWLGGPRFSGGPLIGDDFA